MKKIVLGLLALLAIGSLTADAQQQTLPANTVVGRLGIGPGPAQAIPFTVFTSSLNTIVGAVQSVKTFGAVCDGVTDDTAAVAAALAAGLTSTPPGAICKVSTAASALSGRVFGFGQIKDGSDNFRASFFSTVSANQAYTATNEDTVNTAFNQGGGFAKVQFPVEHRITGAATLTQPTTGYVYSPWAYPHYTYLYNESGWNNGTADNIGRTAAVAYRTQVFQNGQGDAVAFNGNVFVTGTRAGSTSFLANPAAVLFNGGVFAGADGVLLGPQEMRLEDQGFDVAGVGAVLSMSRTNATGAKGAFWAGHRVQSIGSQPLDVGYALIGKANYGVDLSFADFGANAAAISLTGNQRFYWNATATDATGLSRYPSAPGAVYSRWNTTTSGLEFIVTNNSPTLQLFGAANGVNFIRMNSGPTGSSAIMEARGGDADVGLLLASRGTGTILFRSQTSGGVDQFRITDTASSNRVLSVTGSNGGLPTMSSSAGGIALAPSDGRLNISGGTPTASACAGFALSTGSSTAAGRVTYTSATTCVINLGVTFTNAPFCTVTPGSAASTHFATTSTTQLSVTFGTAQTAFFYHCFGA